MKRFAIVMMALAAAGWGSMAEARMNDDECAEQVAQECGPVPFEQCFDDASMWDKIAPECTGYVQTNLENAREANQ
jgi:hypothetical protein